LSGWNIPDIILGDYIYRKKRWKIMVRNFLFIFTFMGLFLGVSACQRLDESELTLPASDAIYLEGVAKADAMEAGEAALARMRFVIDKFDVERGLIKSRYLSAGQFLEFWRKDNVGAERAAEANLHSIQRQAVLHFTESGGKLRIQCQVNTRRLSLPEQEVHGMSRAAGMFTEGSRTLQQLKLEEEDLTWMELGPDPRLEIKILESMTKYALEG
jgi:hypothetical protein